MLRKRYLLLVLLLLVMLVQCTVPAPAPVDPATDPATEIAQANETATSTMGEPPAEPPTTEPTAESPPPEPTVTDTPKADDTGGADTGSVFATIPGPELCRAVDRDNPPVAPGGNVDFVENLNLGDGGVTAIVPYENQIGQRFQLRISSMDPGTVDEYLRDLQICFEVISTNAGIPDEGYWAEQGDGIAVESGPLEMPFDPDSAIDETALNNMTIDQIMVNAVDPATVFIELVVLDAGEAGQQGEEVVVHYLIDPLINRRPPHVYVARCATSAWAQIWAVAGKATVYLYQGTLSSRHATADSARNPWTVALAFSNAPPPMTYDVAVFGNQDGSSYHIYGGWVQGSGGACQ